eukprot:7363128-Prymnesium_polylepis.1
MKLCFLTRLQRTGDGASSSREHSREGEKRDDEDEEASHDDLRRGRGTVQRGDAQDTGRDTRGALRHARGYCALQISFLLAKGRCGFPASLN